MAEHSLLSAVVAGVLECAVQLGHDRETLVREARLDPALLADPDARVPYAHDLALWTVLARQPVGLAIGERLGAAGLGVLGFAMRHGATVGDALAWLGRYRALVHPDLVPRVELRSGPEGNRLVLSRPPTPDFARLREPVYAQAAATVAVMRSLTGRRDVRARWVAYPVPRPADPDRHETYFGCPVAWGAPEFGIAFDAALLALPLPQADPQLFRYLERRADALLANLPADDTTAARVRREVEAMLAHGEPRLAEVARRLAVSERTLHRRLSEEATQFSAIVDDVRRARAEQLLEEPRLSSSEVAFLLGYAEPAAFFRAFKRWTGVTPQAWRQSAGQAPR